MRRTIFIVAVAFAALLLLPSAVMGMSGIHGGYSLDTDACAGCHRAHTSVSSITWSDGVGDNSALLTSNASTIDEFCMACHDASSEGAETNVEEGVYEGTEFGSIDATLNGGGFSDVGDSNMAMTSSHISFSGWTAWGGGLYGQGSVGATGDAPSALGGPVIDMSCTSCHDPHGSSNYRSLSDVVFGNTVGGYAGGVDSTYNPTPQPFVISTEYGYPIEGFRLHVDYGATTYTPDFTTPRYAKGPGGNTSKGMSGWCAGCHATYTSVTTTYNAADGWDYEVRHKHPVNVAMNTFDGDRSLIVTAQVLPLAHDPSEATTGTLAQQGTDWIECLTCHVAHGAVTTMEGYANVDSVFTLDPDSGIGGVDPANSSALLRLNNRGVCEVCHNK